MNGIIMTVVPGDSIGPDPVSPLSSVGYPSRLLVSTPYSSRRMRMDSASPP